MMKLPFWDMEVFRAVNLTRGGEVIDSLALFLSSAQTWWGVAGFILLSGLFLKNKKLMKALVLCALCLGVSDLVSARLLKPQIKRNRPCYQIEVNLRSGRCGSQFGMPSNHAANAAAVVAAVTVFYTGLPVWIVGTLAFLVGLSRVYLGVHFPGDVLAGFFVGSLIGWGVSRTLLKLGTWPTLRLRSSSPN